MQAYRQLARVLHPDKGGSSTAFAALQAAFKTLNNPKTRAVYDALAADVRFKPGAAAPYSSSGFQASCWKMIEHSSNCFGERCFGP